MNSIQTIGILGAGKLGITLSQLALKAGYEVNIAGSGDPENISLTVDVIAPGAKAKSASEVIKNSDIIILALPLSKFKSLSPSELSGKLVIDAMNYWWEVDGPREDILSDVVSTSEAVQEFFSSSHVVKAFNHMGYHDLHDESAPSGSQNRKAIAIAGDHTQDVAAVSEIVDRLGFDPLPIGELKEGQILEAGNPAFGANLTKEKLQMLLEK